MTRSPRHASWIRLALATAAATLLVAAAPAAHADRVSAVTVGPGGTYYVPPHRIHHPVRARRLVVAGSLWAGNLTIGWRPVSYAPPPPPPPMPEPQVESCYCSPATVAPAQPVVRVARRAPRLALGAFAGGVDVEGGATGDSLGLLGRLKLSRHLGVEAELSRDSIDAGIREDGRAGAALLLDLMPGRFLNPYLVGGMGAVFTDVNNGDYQSRDPYAEVGAGLELNITRHLAVAVEARAGARRVANQVDGGEVVLSSTTMSTTNDSESYTRGRLSALIRF